MERERQKTKRQMMFYLLMGSIAILRLILFFRGSEGNHQVDIDLTKGKFKFNVDQPIVEQVNQTTQTTTSRGKQVNFTTGMLNPEVIDQLHEANISISPD